MDERRASLPNEPAVLELHNSPPTDTPIDADETQETPPKELDHQRRVPQHPMYGNDL